VDKATLPGLLLGIGALMVAVLLEGGSLASLINFPAAVIVFGGTFSVALVNFPLQTVLGVGKFFTIAVKDTAHDLGHVVESFVRLADKARREGLLALEQEAPSLDPFSRKGIQMVVDGSDASVVREIMEADIDAMRRRHHDGIAVFEALGGFAPTLGIIGTVMGLVNVLGHLEDPSQLGHLIAGAFIATLYGVASANLVYLPLAGKLKHKSQGEVALRELTIEGLLSVQAGDNPRMVREKLESFLPPSQREGAEVANGDAGGRSAGSFAAAA
jgi:chemotaxis protein MotA